MSEIGLGDTSDAEAVSRLHATLISEGFLASLGSGFLGRLYRRVVRSPGSFVVVARESGSVIGFCAASTDTGRLYREFVARDGVPAAISAAPRLLRSARRVYETLRYPASGADLPAAEVLSIAVDPEHARRGIGGRLLAAACAELSRRGVTDAKVVVGAANAAAIAMYRSGGFVSETAIEMHPGTRSEVMVWRSPPSS